ncbi:MAG: serine hydrolase [Rhodothermaceae bacterium]|nr:serine hydrolase [Rhodothermaceae bacterium]
MRSLLFVLLTVVSFTTTCAQPLGDAEAFSAMMDTFVPEVLSALDGTVPGVSMAVVRGDEVVYLGGFGMADVEAGLPATPETAFYIASSTKSFTALAAALLNHDGALDLDAPVTQYAPGVAFDPAVGADQVTLRDLLTHTHGFDNGPIGFRAAFTGEHTPEVMWQLLAETRPNEEAPHGTFDYTNEGYNILSLVLDRETGQPWQDLLDARLFTPLGMDRTTAYASEPERMGWPVAAPYNALGPDGTVERIYLAKQDNTMQAAGGMYTTAADAARWLEVQLSEGRLDGEQVFPPEVLHETHRRWAETDASYGPFVRKGYGLGWYVGTYDEEPMVHHFGGFGGAHSHISFMPEHDLGVAVFVNEAGVGGRVAILLSTLAYDWWRGVPEAQAKADAFVGQLPEQLAQARTRAAGGRASRAERSWTLSQPFEAYAGTYVSPRYGTLVVTVEDGAAVVRLGNLWAVATPFTAPETMRVELIPGSGRVVGFEADDTGAFTRARFDDEVFERVE